MSKIRSIAALSLLLVLCMCSPTWAGPKSNKAKLTEDAARWIESTTAKANTGCNCRGGCDCSPSGGLCDCGSKSGLVVTDSYGVVNQPPLSQYMAARNRAVAEQKNLIVYVGQPVANQLSGAISVSVADFPPQSGDTTKRVVVGVFAHGELYQVGEVSPVEPVHELTRRHVPAPQPYPVPRPSQVPLQGMLSQASQCSTRG